MRGIKFEDFIDISNKPDVNIIIITIDCLRSSNLSSQGYYLKTTPFLDTQDSKFEAISPSCFTYSAVPSILTGLYPHNHNAIINGKIKLPNNVKNFLKIREKILTLPEILYALGYNLYYSTAINLAEYPLRSRIFYPKKYIYNNCEKLLNNAKKWIAKTSQPFFTYIHLGDLHIPLNPPKNFRNFFETVKNIPNIKTWDYVKYPKQKGKKFEEYKENRILLYDNTLRYVDYSIKNFYNFLDDHDLLDSTIFIITADHGEEFWEYAKLESLNFNNPAGWEGINHGHNVFNKIIEVPILMSGQGIPKMKSNSVSTIDIMPTILDLLKVNHKLEFDGVNLFEQKKNRLLLSEGIGYGYEKKSLIEGKYKLIYSEGDNVQWLFDLEQDPKEKRPIAGKEITNDYFNKLLQLYKIEEENKILKSISKLKYF